MELGLNLQLVLRVLTWEPPVHCRLAAVQTHGSRQWGKGRMGQFPEWSHLLFPGQAVLQGTQAWPKLALDLVPLLPGVNI